ncbi:translation initiation factor IF-6 [Promethearchaeum syntrophicum]|uniref:Translation initiation factor 6 n=1 Tax=Promethearchaeum syntrophicum TaxID=2594042 RepID=A0A5B9DFH2_9ARCH|nr:translation initiation factor IF-6 [Candidatus Prometheoarchaeum syntrophicum]QEE17457.1 Translation initiation factor 6 [Candidatus Prometheoarchaeum syntrophicum]
MPILKEIIYGNQEVGTYLALNNDYFLYPQKINPKIVNFITQNQPEIVTIETFIAGSPVIGSFVAMNSYGMIVPDLIYDDELDLLQKNTKKEFQITSISLEDNAFGNLILCNDKGAIISPKLKEAREIIEKALKVPTRVLRFADSDLAGSCGLANNSGVLLHPMVTEEEAEIIGKTLRVDEVDVSTINCGSPYLSGGVTVNDSVAIFGQNSTGPELQRIMEILQLE